MRSTTVLSFLVAGVALFSPVYAAPIPTEAGSAVAKRQCYAIGCKLADTPATTSASSQDSTAQLVQALLDTLTAFQGTTPNPPSTSTGPTLDAVTPVSGKSDPLLGLVSGAL